MAVFIWNEKFSVRMEAMDNQHKHFLNLLNKLDDEIQRKGSDEMVQTAIGRIFNYATIHFRDEENILFTCVYPGIEHQMREHNFFLRQVRVMEANLRGGSRKHLGSVVSFLMGWFINHIMVDDKKYAEFIRICGPGDRHYFEAV